MRRKPKRNTLTRSRVPPLILTLAPKPLHMHLHGRLGKHIDALTDADLVVERDRLRREAQDYFEHAGEIREYVRRRQGD
jgi:hypothetical protein